MRVLLVSHNFLPRHPAGTEIYTYHLGRALLKRGHEVHVFTTEKDISQPNLSLHPREYYGLQVHELVNNLFYEDFRQTWDYPPAADAFERFVDDLQPDVVHFMHFLYLSVECLEIAARRAPVFFTLHDYWLQCPRFGQRVHADRSICHKIDFARCGRCLASFKYAQTPAQRRGAKAVAWLRRRTGVDLGPKLRRLARALQRRGSGLDAPPGSLRMPESPELQPPPPTDLSPEEAALRDLVAGRDAELRERVLGAVTRFVAPSRFLRKTFVDWGLPEERVLRMRTGIDLSPFQGFERVNTTKLRVGFIGTVVPHKGLHVLLRAWKELPAALRAKAELVVYGPLNHTPDYVHAVADLADEVGVPLRGRLAAEEVPNALRSIDLLVVPSVWYENSPLIILEALATRTPLMVSKLGGMAELVEEGRSGFHFEVGDHKDLGHRLRIVLEDPSVLQDLYVEARPVRPIEADAEQVETWYHEALAERAGGSAAS